jgi:carboxymethylenebutenolidase
MNPKALLLPLLVFSSTPVVADEPATMARMAQEHRHDKPAATPAARQEPAQPVTAEKVSYGEVGGKTLNGYLAQPKSSKGPLPGLIVIHEWWGLNDNIQAMTRRLAGEGYQALAVDVFGGTVAEKPDLAMKLVNQALENRAVLEQNLRRAAAFLQGKGAKKIGVVGWCFGGGLSLNTALDMPEKIDAAVIYYGHLETNPTRLAKLDSPVLGLFGGQDQSIPVATVGQFESALKKLGKPVEIKIYEGAGHAFANSSGGNYKAEAAQDAWTRTVAFFKKHLQG